MYKQSAFYQIRVKIAFILHCDLKCIRHSKAVLLSKMKKMVQVHCGQRKITQIKTRGSKEPVSLTLVYVHIKQRTQMDS